MDELLQYLFPGLQSYDEYMDHLIKDLDGTLPAVKDIESRKEHIEYWELIADTYGDYAIEYIDDSVMGD